MKLFRCRTCNFQLVHDGQQKHHVGHTWVNATNSTLSEDIKIIGWLTWEMIKKLFAF